MKIFGFEIFGETEKKEQKRRLFLYDKLSGISDSENLFYRIFNQFKNDNIFKYEINKTNECFSFNNLNNKINIFFTKFNYFEINNYCLNKDNVENYLIDDGYNDLEIKHIKIGEYKNNVFFVRHNGLFLYNILNIPDMGTPEYFKESLFLDLVIEILIKKYENLNETDFKKVVKELLKL